MTGWEMVTFIKNKTVFPSLPFFYLKTWVQTHAHTHTHTHTPPLLKTFYSSLYLGNKYFQELYRKTLRNEKPRLISRAHLVHLLASRGIS